MVHLRLPSNSVPALVMVLGVMAVAAPAVAATQFTFTDPVDTSDGLDIVEVVAWWEPATSLTVDMTFDNVTDGVFPSQGWVEIALDTDLDSQADNLIHVGNLFVDVVEVRVCDRTSSSSFTCVTTFEVTHAWQNGSTLRVEIEGVPSIIFGEQVAIRAAAQRSGVWDLAPALGWWTLYDLAVDTTPPVVETNVDSVILLPTSLDGATIETLPPWALTVNDDLDSDPTLTCDPPAGTFLPIGQTTVVCTATDASGNVSEPVSLTVEVLAPSAVLESASDALLESDTQGAVGMAALLMRAADQLDRGQIQAACGTTGAFLNASEHSREFEDWIRLTVDYVYRLADCR